MKVLVQFKITLVDDSGKVLKDEVQHDIKEVLEVEAARGATRTKKDVSRFCSIPGREVTGTGLTVSVAVADWLKNLCSLSLYVPYREKRRHEIAIIREGLRGISGEELDRKYISMGITDFGIVEAFMDEYQKRGRTFP